MYKNIFLLSSKSLIKKKTTHSLDSFSYESITEYRHGSASSWNISYTNPGQNQQFINIGHWTKDSSRYTGMYSTD